MEDEPKCSWVYDTALFLLLLLEFLIAEDVLYLQTIEDRISGFEEKLLEKIPDHFYQSIISCRKEISVYHSYYEQLMNLSDQIQEFCPTRRRQRN